MKWEALPLADRARLMAAAVKNGYTDIRSIKEAYANYLNLKLSTDNRYAEGGDTNDEDEYHDSFYEWKKAISKYMGLKVDNDDTYDYMSFYYDNPARAWAMLEGDPNAHFTDEYKTANHPTFSDESNLSGKYDPIYNPLVASGGTWTENPNTFILPKDWYKGPSIQDRITYLENAENNGVTMLMPDGSLPTLYNNEPWGGVLPNVEIVKQKAYGGNLFLNGGNKSKQSKKDYYRQLLIIRGLRGAQLEAVLANMEVESGFNPNAHNKSSGAHGLMQWLGSRKPKSWSEKDQLDYIAATYNKFGGNEWLDKKAWKRFNETTDPVEAARLFRRYWERPEKSSWYATDKYFEKSYLPLKTNDLISQVQDITWDDVQERRKRFELTPEEEKLYNSKPTLFYNADYADWNDPTNSKTFEQAYAPYALNSELDNTPSNGWALYNSLLNSQSLNDPLSWMTMMASLSPKTTSQQKDAASLYQLFAPQGDDYMYHGLNFAAYGGKVNKFDGLEGSSIIDNQRPYSKTFETAREANAYLNYLRETGLGANTMFEGNNLDNELTYINSLPVDERGVFIGPSITYHAAEPFSDRSYTDVLADYKTNQRLNRWNWTGDWDYYKDMAEWKRQHPYQNMMYDALSTLPAWPMAIPLLEGVGAAYSMLPATAQGGLNLLGAVEGYNDFTKNTAPLLKDAYNRGDWKDLMFNTGRSLLDLTGVVGGTTPAVTKGLNAANHYVVRPARASLKFAINARPKEIPRFWDNLKLDWHNPEVNVIDAINLGRYRMSVNTSANQARKLRETAETTFNGVLDNIANKLSSGQDASKIDELQQTVNLLKKDTNIYFDPYYWDTHKLTNPADTNLLDQVLNDPSGLTTKFEINYPLLRRNSNTNVMISPEEWLSATAGWHEPVHVAQYGLYPHVFEDGTYTYNFLGQQQANFLSPLSDVTKKLGSFRDPQSEYSYDGNLIRTPWEKVSWYRLSPEFDAEMLAYLIKNGMPKITEMSLPQRENLTKYMYGTFGDDANGVTWDVVNELIDMFGKHGFSYGGNIINS